ncbi:MAG: hypothetical protein MJ089_00070 [Ruminococcus sp.]|nr:hypothetical protein [Ruminococcus sp.]
MKNNKLSFSVNYLLSALLVFCLVSCQTTSFNLNVNNFLLIFSTAIFVGIFAI